MWSRSQTRLCGPTDRCLSPALLIEPEKTIDKLLRGAGGRAMQFRRVPHHLEARTEFPVKSGGIVANDIEATATARTFRSECADDDVTARPQRQGNVTHVCRSIR